MPLDNQSVLMVRLDTKDLVHKMKKASGLSLTSITASALESYANSDEFRSVVKLAQLRMKNREGLKNLSWADPEEGGGDDSL